MRGADVLLTRLKVAFKNAPVPNIPGMVKEEMELFRADVRDGMSVAVTVGSRGIFNIAGIVKAVVEALASYGAKPFIIPAMGSHGGATAEGQKAVLAEYGVTEEAMGVPVLSSMDVVKLGTLPGDEGLPLYMDKLAAGADAVFVVNRVKAHTDFHGDNESGIAKMLSIGLGKHAQALVAHGYLSDGLRSFVPRMADTIQSMGKVLGALAIVEDGYDQTSILRAVKPRDIVRVDAELLKISKAMTPALPFQSAHVLLVDWLGKNISGTGMDPNIIGRAGIRGEPDSPPHTEVICLFDLTPESHGNALGVGLADLVPRRLTDKVDWKVTYENVRTSRFLCRGATPVTLPTDREVVDMGLFACGHVGKETLRLARIRNTLRVDEIYVTDALLNEAKATGRVEVMESGVPLVFSEDGTLQKLP
ncbi:MAG: DUF362 domain-containing protein [Synergistaceae bacterium]|nr:DUF362 domain-containing protein [Synergistaceae bacterium]